MAIPTDCISVLGSSGFLCGAWPFEGLATAGKRPGLLGAITFGKGVVWGQCVGQSPSWHIHLASLLDMRQCAVVTHLDADQRSDTVERWGTWGSNSRRANQEMDHAASNQRQPTATNKSLYQMGKSVAMRSTWIHASGSLNHTRNGSTCP